MNKLDVIIPVYNEGKNIMEVIRAFQREVRTPFRLFICYDRDEDDTLPVLREAGSLGFEVVFVKNRGAGVHEAIVTGFEAASAPAVLVFPADEPYNAKIVDRMYEAFEKGNDVVVASRFMEGGHMEGGPLLKSVIVRLASFLLRHFVGIPASDATYGLRLFSKRILDTVAIESTQGFTYAIELLMKCHRLRWNVAEIPASWYRRVKGESRFNLKKWLPHYMRWFFYALATTYLRKSPDTVTLKPGARLI